MELPDDAGNLHFLTEKKWLSENATYVGTLNGAMRGDIMKHVITNVNNKMRKYKDQDAPPIALMGEHSNPNGYRWVTDTKVKNIEVVQAPDNTSCFLQTNDHIVNRTIYCAIRPTRDRIVCQTLAPFGDILLKLRLGVVGFCAIKR